MLGLCYDLTKLYFYVTSPIPSAFFRIVGTLRSCAFCQPAYMFSTWYKRSSHCLEVFSLCTITVLTNPYSLRTWVLLAYAKLHSQYHVITWCPSYIDQLSFYLRPCLRQVTNFDFAFHFVNAYFCPTRVPPSSSPFLSWLCSPPGIVCFLTKRTFVLLW